MTTPHSYTVRIHKGRPTIFDNDQPRPAVMYSPGDAFGNLAREDVDRFLAAGVTDFYLWVGRDETAQDFATTPWWHSVDRLGEPKFVAPERWKSLPEMVEYVIRRAPDARFLLRYFARVPKSWQEAHPEELAIDENGKTYDETSLASERYERDHARFLRHMVQWIERQPWAWRVMGYLTMHEGEGTTIMAGVSSSMLDYSAPMQRAFREFIRQRYATDAALREAWGKPDASREAVVVPAYRFHEERLRGGSMQWRNAKDTQDVRDYLELVRSLFYRRCTLFTETVTALCAPRQVLLGMDALKQAMQGWMCGAFFLGHKPRAHYGNMLPGSGSFGADEFFKIPGFNVLETPHDYIYRQAGGGYEPEGIVDSVVLRGKLFLGENDYRTYNCSENHSYGYARDDAEAEAALWRTAAGDIARGSQSYWMDVTSFAPPRGGYFRSAPVMKVIQSIVPVMRRSQEWEHADVPGIAMIIDDRSGLEEDFSSDFQNLAVIWQRLTGLAHAGVPYRIYLWEDLLADTFPDHRLFVFPNLFRMDEQRLEILRRRVCRNGRVVLWGPATGITDGRTLGADWASRVTGMPMAFLNESYSRRVVLTRFDHPATARLHGSIAYGDNTPYGPILVPERDPAVSEQGIVLTSRGVHHAGLAIKDMGDWTSVFSAAVPVPADLLRELARHAGAHVYSEDNDVIMAAKHFLGVHFVRPGHRTIALPATTPVWDAVTRRPLSAGTNRIDIEVTPPQTRLFTFCEP